MAVSVVLINLDFNIKIKKRFYEFQTEGKNILSMRVQMVFNCLFLFVGQVDGYRVCRIGSVPDQVPDLFKLACVGMAGLAGKVMRKQTKAGSNRQAVIQSAGSQEGAFSAGSDKAQPK